MTTEPTFNVKNTQSFPIKDVLVCDMQPLVVVGVRALLNEQTHLRFAESTESLSDALDTMVENRADVVIIDKAFGINAICGWLTRLEEHRIERPSVIVWGTVSRADTMRLLHAGVRGVLGKTARTSAFLACLQTVARGRTWLEDRIFRDQKYSDHLHNALTAREQEVLEKVQHGLSNRDIARELGIQLGTVKIHLKHIFEKTGIRGRHHLALGRDAGDANVPDVPVIRAHSLAVA